MKLSMKFALLFLALSFTQGVQAEKVSEKDWKQYLPVTGKSIQADVMQIKTSDELEKLADKIKEGMRKNPEWALEFMRSAPKGQPLPYHENLGLTKNEYERMLELSQNQGGISLQKNGTIPLTFEPLPDGRIQILSTKDSLLSNLVISTDKISTDKVVTSFGDLTNVSEINNQDPNAITGAWKGIKWSKETINEEKMTGESIQFCIGKIEGKAVGIIYYDGKVLNGLKKPPMQFSQIIFFPLAK